MINGIGNIYAIQENKIFLRKITHVLVDGSNVEVLLV